MAHLRGQVLSPPGWPRQVPRPWCAGPLPRLATFSHSGSAAEGVEGRRRAGPGLGGLAYTVRDVDRPFRERRACSATLYARRRAIEGARSPPPGDDTPKIPDDTPTIPMDTASISIASIAVG